MHVPICMLLIQPAIRCVISHPDRSPDRNTQSWCEIYTVRLAYVDIARTGEEIGGIAGFDAVVFTRYCLHGEGSDQEGENL